MIQRCADDACNNKVDYTEIYCTVCRPFVSLPKGDICKHEWLRYNYSLSEKIHVYTCPDCLDDYEVDDYAM